MSGFNPKRRGPVRPEQIERARKARQITEERFAMPLEQRGGGLSA